jgi:hypothetical protein
MIIPADGGLVVLAVVDVTVVGDGQQALASILHVYWSGHCLLTHGPMHRPVAHGQQYPLTTTFPLVHILFTAIEDAGAPKQAAEIDAGQ